jgi:sarcosine oxidase
VARSFVTRTEFIVVGAGAMGAAAAWQLALRGREVLVLDRFHLGHVRGSSHGSARIFRLSYPEPLYVRFASRALELWRDLELDSGEILLHVTGGVDHGSRRQLEPLIATLECCQRAYFRLSPAEAAHRWPGLRFENEVLYSPEAGRLDADKCVQTLIEQSISDGAQFLFESPARSVRPLSDRTIEVLTDTSRIIANHAIITSGAWTESLLRGVVQLPSLVVTLQQPAHFPVQNPADDWPSFVHYREQADGTAEVPAYGVRAPEGVKVGIHGRGKCWNPDNRSPGLDEPASELLQTYVRQWIPGVVSNEPAPLHCLYTSTNDENFVIDRIGPLTVGCGFSGHGFKFVPAVGELLADLATGMRSTEEIFSFRARR